MENAAQALKIAGFTLLFVGALALAVLTITQAKNTSQTILNYKDKTNYYTYIDEGEKNLSSNRKIKLKDIIPTLYRYNTEKYRIEFYDVNGNPIELYKLGNSNAISKWKTNNGYLATYDSINFLDLDDENSRNEAWVGDTQKIKTKVDEIVNTLEDKYSSNTFKEEIGQYSYSEASDNGANEVQKRIIKYTIIE